MKMRNLLKKPFQFSWTDSNTAKFLMPSCIRLKIQARAPSFLQVLPQLSHFSNNHLNCIPKQCPIQQQDPFFLPDNSMDTSMQFNPQFPGASHCSASTTTYYPPPQPGTLFPQITPSAAVDPSPSAPYNLPPQYPYDNLEEVYNQSTMQYQNSLVIPVNSCFDLHSGNEFVIQ